MHNNILNQIAINYPWPEAQPDVTPFFENDGAFDDSHVRLMGQFLDDKTKIVIELGSWFGFSTRFILDTAPNATVICVDHWKGSPNHWSSNNTPMVAKLPELYETFMVNFWNDQHRIIPLKNDTVIGLKEIWKAGATPDLIYVDASHEYEDVFVDVLLSLKFFPESRICGDDWYLSGVRDAVTNIAKQNNLKISVENGRVWCFQMD